MPSHLWPPVPPIDMPAARTLRVPGRGELFLRDTGGDGPAVMLLHGWIATADLNWCGAYADLAAAGYRVLAIDHRGHGRGLRQMAPFRRPHRPRRCGGSGQPARACGGARGTGLRGGNQPPRDHDQRGEV